ncbi:MAG: DegV family protein, partial [Angelakisella sp.]
AKAIPTHAQVTMMEFTAEFKRQIALGYHELICITITSKGSGMNDAANLAKQQLFEEQPQLAAQGVTIDVVDSMTYSYVYGQAILEAAKAVQAGKTRQEVVALLHYRLEHYFAIVGLTNLTYAKKSGRITTVAAFVGEVMGFRPILTVQEGILETIAKVRGDSKLIDGICERYRSQAAENGEPYYIICADSMDNAKLLQKKLQQQTKNPFGGYHRIGPSVTTNAGPTIFGVVAPK